MNQTTYGPGAHASLFAYVSREVMEKYADGEETMREAVIRYGHERGGRMRQRAIRDGLPLDMSTYLLYREYPVDPADFEGPEEHLPTGDFHSTPTRCPWSGKWRELGLTRYCGVYCRHVDHALAESFAPGCLLESTGNLTDGDAHCDLWFRGVNIQDPAVQEKMRTFGPRIKASNAIKGWDYQLAHTYVSLGRTFSAHYPAEEVAELMRAAVAAFEGEYGAGSARDFLALTYLDFDSTAEYTGA